MGCNNTFVSCYWLISILTVLLCCSLGFPLFQSSPVCLFVSSWASMLLAHLCHCPSKSCESELWCAWPLWSSVCNKKITINNLTAEICACHSCQSSNLSGPLCIIGYCANTWPFFQIKTSRIQTKCCNVFPELPQWLHYQPCKVFFLFVDSKQEHCKVLLILFQMLRQWLHFSRLMD